MSGLYDDAIVDDVELAVHAMETLNIKELDKIVNANWKKYKTPTKAQALFIIRGRNGATALHYAARSRKVYEAYCKFFFMIII
jgi:hypothetical protein